MKSMCHCDYNHEVCTSPTDITAYTSLCLYKVQGNIKIDCGVHGRLNIHSSTKLSCNKHDNELQ